LEIVFYPGATPVVFDSHAHLHPGQADVAARDGNRDDAVLDVRRDHQRTRCVDHRPRAVTAAGETVSDARKLPRNARHPSSREGRADVSSRVTGETFVGRRMGRPTPRRCDRRPTRRR
jgi:hypothetical protein